MDFGSCSNHLSLFDKLPGSYVKQLNFAVLQGYQEWFAPTLYPCANDNVLVAGYKCHTESIASSEGSNALNMNN